MLWTDYFKPPHFEKYPQLNQLFNEATKLAGAGGTKGSTDVAKADELLAKIDEIAKIFWETKQGVAQLGSAVPAPPAWPRRPQHVAAPPGFGRGVPPRPCSGGARPRRSRASEPCLVPQIAAY